MQTSAGVTYLHGDNLGSTSVASTASGALVSRQTYYAFGAMRTSDVAPITSITEYNFTGQPFDSYINLIQMGARWYDSDLGRFIQPDSIVPNLYNPQDLNRYSYVKNNPIKYTDPTGHDVIIIPGLFDDNDYNDPKSWKKWIVKYKGWTDDQYNKWEKDWKDGSDEDRKNLAKETGVAIFDWSKVPNGNIGGTAKDAAKAVQKQIDDWGLKDVTTIGHSKGAVTGATLLGLYENGTLDKGNVKKMVLIDPPQTDQSDWFFGGNTKADAERAGVRTVFLPGQYACDASSCQSRVENVIQFTRVNHHNIRTEMAETVYDVLGIYGDAHARPYAW